ncbi:MAG: UvrD-helicase domain-containing protein [Parcubacteria group bacterium]|nr:UvrD-helicase domain-containing protein [Parcubacteria group bacterium]
MNQEHLIETLNPSQRKAVQMTDGPLLIIAGAGSGKTKTLTHRVAHLIAQGVPPSQILAVTFTNKAAAEMRSRILKLVSSMAASPSSSLEPNLANELTLLTSSFIGTFHSLGAKLLREEAAQLRRTPHFTIVDADDALSIIKTITKELNLDKEKFPPQQILSSISFRKNNPDKERSEHNFYESIISNIQTKYEERLEAMNAFDFDDLILKPGMLFLHNEDILKKHASRWRYILIDEYQDINPSQYLLMKLLAQSHRNICAVGDDAQSIYSWRGADFTIFLDFEKDWPEATTVLLEENYRSTQNILSAANAVIANNNVGKEKNLFTQNEVGPPVYLVESDSDSHEARICIDTILGLIKNKLAHLDRIAILYRTNAQSRILEEMCIQARLAYQVIGGTRFYDRKEVKDILAYLKLIINPKDTLSLERIINVPARGLGKEAIKLMSSLAASPSSSLVTNELSSYRAIELSKYRNKTALLEFLTFLETLRTKANESTLTETINHLVREIKFKEYLNLKTEEGIRRWENVVELINAASQYDTRGNDKMDNLSAFLETANLYQDADQEKNALKGIKLMTIHAAKGLEFETVFVVGLEEGVLPHERSLTEDVALEEERRLAYVALTRAKKALYLSFARQRKVFGALKMNPPSRFIAEIPNHLIEYTNATTSHTHIDEDFIEYN